MTVNPDSGMEAWWRTAIFSQALRLVIDSIRKKKKLKKNREKGDKREKSPVAVKKMRSH